METTDLRPTPPTDQFVSSPNASHGDDPLGHFGGGAKEVSVPAPSKEIVGPADLSDRRTHTDLGLSRRFAQEAKGKVLFLRDQETWITWSGNRWLLDKAKIGPRQVASLVADGLWREIAGNPSGRSDAGLLRFIQASGSKRAIDAMVSLGATAEGMCTDSSNLDNNPYLLNCENGVLDLRTLELLPHSPELMQTQLANVVFDKTANCPRWKAFIEEVTCGDVELAAFLQRSFGVAISADVSCQAFWVHYGQGANGKSTAIEVISAILGDYAGPIAAEALLANPRGHDKERALTTSTLVGKRLAVAAEPDSGMRLSEGMIKSLTGAETVEARHLYGKPFKAVPTWHPHFTVNHKPLVRGTDNGIWRRVMLVPWNATFRGDKADPYLKEKLLGEASGILNWLLYGFSKFRDLGGLCPPACVTEATDEYRDENDRFGAWLEEHCVLSLGTQTAAADLYSNYSGWCKTNNEFTLSSTAFGKELNKRNLRGEKIGGRRVWHGISLINFFNQDR